jgi:hypothetical protein
MHTLAAIAARAAVVAAVEAHQEAEAQYGVGSPEAVSADAKLDRALSAWTRADAAQVAQALAA